MQKITPHLWYDTQAKEAAKLYTTVFPDSKILSSSQIENTPSGNTDILTISLFGQEFQMISAGPLFKFNPSVSFLVACDSAEEVEKYWNAFIEGGSALMELGEYPFSSKYGWLQDKFGLSWQFMQIGEMKPAQKITPTIMFVQEQAGNAEAAMQFYTSIFEDSKIGEISRYPEGLPSEKPDSIMHADFTLAGQGFACMDSGSDHKFQFNEAISFIVNCEDQKEIDYFWEKLSAMPESEQCGWLKDRYGFSWQIVPKIMEKMLSDSDPEKLKRVTEAFLKMKKLDISKLEAAYKGE